MKSLAIVAAVMLVLDTIWEQATMASSRQVVAKIQRNPMKIRSLAEIIAYALMIGAVWFFAVETSKSWQDAAVRGALLGLAMYGMFDMTNYATLNSYPLEFAIRDIMWGTVLFAVTAGAARAL